MGSLGAMIYLIARKIPLISDRAEENGLMHPKGFFGKVEFMIESLPLEKMDFAFSRFFEKKLRQLRIGLMKMDNYLVKHLETFKNIKNARHSLNVRRARFEKLYESQLENNGGAGKKEADATSKEIE